MSRRRRKRVIRRVAAKYGLPLPGRFALWRFRWRILRARRTLRKAGLVQPLWVTRPLEAPEWTEAELERFNQSWKQRKSQ